MKHYGPALRRSSGSRLPTSQARSTTFGMAETGRLFEDWSGASITTDSMLANQLVTMRNRSRAFARDEDYAKAYLIAARNNIVGPNGVTLQMQVTNPPRPTTLPDGSSEWVSEPDTMANDAIEEAYAEFSAATNIDAEGVEQPSFCVTGNLSRVEFADLGITTAERDGEFLCRLHRGFANRWSFAVEPINADHLDETKNEMLRDGGQIRLGVQRNAAGQITHYWLRKWIVGDNLWPRQSDPYLSYPVPASEIIHFYFAEDFAQSRGVPSIHAGAQRLKMLSGWEEATLEAARAAACKHEYFKRMVDPNAPVPEYTPDAYSSEGVPLSDVSPGTREELPAGYDVVSIDPKYPTTEHGAFINSTIGGVAAGLGVSRMTLTGDLSQANYSSMRAGLLPERDLWLKKQHHWIAKVETRIFLAWLRMALLNQSIRLPNGSVLPAARFDKFAKPSFQGRRWAWIDPKADQEANNIALAQRTTTRSAVVAQQGGDIEEIARSIARERRLYARLGIELPEDLAQASALQGVQGVTTPAQQQAAQTQQP